MRFVASKESRHSPDLERWSLRHAASRPVILRLRPGLSLSRLLPQLGGRKRGWLSGIGHSQLAGRIIPSDLFPSACILPQAKGDGQVVQHRSFSALSPCSLLRAEQIETLSDEESREGD